MRRRSDAELTETGRLFRARLAQQRRREREAPRPAQFRAAARLRMIQPAPSDDDLLSSGDVARLLNVNPRTVARWTDEGLPAFCTMGGHRRFLWADVKGWLVEAQVRP